MKNKRLPIWFNYFTNTISTTSSITSKTNYKLSSIGFQIITVLLNWLKWSFRGFKVVIELIEVIVQVLIPPRTEE